MFVLYGTPDPELQQVVDARDLRRYFVEVHGSPPGKPETAKDIVARHGLAPHDVVLVGDAPLDQEAAVTAGIGFVGRVPPGQPSPFVPGTRTIVDLNGLDAALSV
jgi:phosphoglycolate phosphatase-like HAD superfamily hydrolase